MATSSLSKYKTEATAALDTVTAYAEKGWAKLKAAGIDDGELKKLRSWGDAIKSAQKGVAEERAVQQQVQLNHQLFITKRAYQDAR